MRADARVKPKYNVSGGAGIFAGAVPDSFDVNIRIDTLADAGSETGAKAYDLPAVHAVFCRKEGWNSAQDCREYYPEYCRAQAWRPKECGFDAIRICLDTVAAGDTSLGTLCDSVAAPARAADTATARLAEAMYCIEKDFPGEAVCGAPRKDCLESKGENLCKEGLWDYCLDRLWKPEACGPGLASYCHDKPRLSETLCRHADAWCADHKDSPLCH